MIAGQLAADFLGDVLGSGGEARPRNYLIHIRKTAGTSLDNAFLALAGEDPGEVASRSYHALKQRSGPYAFITNPENARAFVFRLARYTYASSHVPAWKLRLRRGTFTITILRDPASRVISLYRYFADDRADAGLAYPSPGMPRADERRWAADGFSAFLDRVDEPSLLNQLYMFSRRLDPEEAARRVRECSLYFFTERFDAGIGALAERVGLPLASRRDRVSVSPTLPTLAELQRLQAMLGREYEFMDLLRADPGLNFVGGFPPSLMSER